MLLLLTRGAMHLVLVSSLLSPDCRSTYRLTNSVGVAAKRLPARGG